MRSMFQRVLHSETGAFNWMWGTDEIEEFFMGKKPESRLQDFTFPEFEEDPDYRKTQDYLRDLGINILEGDIPDYYKGIGEPGGAEFENYLNLMTGDIKEAGLESAAAIGRGGGAVQDITSRAVGEFTTKSRYADFLRAMEGKGFLFQQGRGITEGVRQAGQTQGQYENVFNLTQTPQKLGLGKYMDEYDINVEKAWGEAESNWIDNIISGGLTAVGVASGNPALAAQGLSGFAGGFEWDKILDEFDFGKDKLSGVTGKKKKAELGSIIV